MCAGLSHGQATRTRWVTVDRSCLLKENSVLLDCRVVVGSKERGVYRLIDVHHAAHAKHPSVADRTISYEVHGQTGRL
jgi:hypothetical protein